LTGSSLGIAVLPCYYHITGAHKHLCSDFSRTN